MAAGRAAITAEWICTRCGVTNRKLAPADATSVSDRCVHCGLKHTVRNIDSPVRWQATAA